MADILCPYCFKHFKSTEVMFRCTNESKRLNTDGTSQRVCDLVEDPNYSNHWGASIPMPRYFNGNFSFFEKIGWKKLQYKKCQCGTQSSKFICPHCHNALPVEMIEKGSEIISIIGGPASGKSNYIVTLLQQLKKYSSKLGLIVTLQSVGRNDNEKTINMYKKGYEDIFEHKTAVPKTQAGSKHIPWIVRLESVSTKKAVYLVFYDTAGENFVDQEEIKRNTTYFLESKAVVVLFDTLAVPKIKEMLKEKNIENNDTESKYGDTLNTIKNIIDSGNSDLKKRPFAFVFSKFDAVVDNSESLGCDVSCFLSDGKFANSSFVKTGVVSLSELDTNSNTISSYLKSEEIWDEDSLQNDIETIWGKNSHFFGVSALGAMTDATKEIQAEKVQPIRVLDPLTWILIKLGGFGIPTKD